MQGCSRRARDLDIKSFADLQQFPLIARANAWLQAHSGISGEPGPVVGDFGRRRKSCSAPPVCSGSFFLGALGSVIGFSIMLFLLFFFLRDGDGMCGPRAHAHSTR